MNSRPTIIGLLWVGLPSSVVRGGATSPPSVSLDEAAAAALELWISNMHVNVAAVADWRS